MFPLDSIMYEGIGLTFNQDNQRLYVFFGWTVFIGFQFQSGSKFWGLMTGPVLITLDTFLAPGDGIHSNSKPVKEEMGKIQNYKSKWKKNATYSSS